MISELLLASQSVQALSTLLKAATGLANYNEIVAAVSEVNSKLMQANAVALASQERQSELTAKIRELESELTRLRDWSAEAAKYEPLQIAQGVFAHVPRNRNNDLQATEKLCSNCFHEGSKSFLQQSFEEMRRIGLNCHRCKSKVVFNGYIQQT